MLPVEHIQGAVHLAAGYLSKNELLEVATLLMDFRAYRENESYRQTVDEFERLVLELQEEE